jgi:tyrosyl-tRNA synthetase
MQKDSVRDRLHNRDQGISFTEFSYQILQGYDFLHLAREEGVTVQCGGSDQWGNIVAGTDLIRRSVSLEATIHWGVATFAGKMFSLLEFKGEYYGAHSSPMAEAEHFLRTAPESIPSAHIDELLIALRSGDVLARLRDIHDRHMAETDRLRDISEDGAFAFTAPLVTKADGGKFGKSEAGAVWLSGPRTTAYAFHQFWLNTADADVERYLKMFTLLTRNEIDALLAEHAGAPEKRAAQRALADAATAIVHGPDAVERANAAAKALFSGEVAGLDFDTLTEVFSAAPSSEHARSILDGEGWSILDALAETGLASSKSQAKEFAKGGGVVINGETKAALDTRLTREHLLHGEVILLRRGKKNWHVCRFG